MNWKRAGLGTAGVIPVIVLLAYGMTRDPKAILSPLPGRAAPDFALEVMPLEEPAGDAGDAGGDAAGTGDTVRLADRRGRIQVINYYASWCLACRDEHPVLTALAPVYKDRGVDFLGILYKDRPSDMRRWIAQMGGQSYPALLDPRTRTAIDYGLYGVPETFFVGTDGRVVKKHIGPVTREVVTATLDSLLAGGGGRGTSGDPDFPADTATR